MKEKILKVTTTLIPAGVIVATLNYTVLGNIIFAIGFIAALELINNKSKKWK